MRKSLFLAMAAVVLLAGCSKESDGITNENGGNDTDVTIDPDAVKINLGMKLPSAEVSPASRAVIDKWNNTTVGIFALVKNAESTWLANTSNQRLLDNLAGTIAADAPNVALPGSFYYPMSQDMYFTFYGYYPKVDTPTIEEKKITATYDISGQEDILWGRAVAPELDNAGTKYNGYNAKYFRKNTGTAVDPSIAFNHKLVRLNFKLKAGLDGGSADQAALVEVTSIDVVCQNRKVSLTIADKDLMNNTTNEEKGTITTAPSDTDFDITDPNQKYLLPLYATYNSDTDNKRYSGKPSKESATEAESIGIPIMLPAPALAVTNTPEEKAYYIKVVLKASDSQNLSTIIPVTTTGEGFVAGSQYNITIVVNGLSEIKINATLEPWKQGTDPGDVEIN